MILHLDFETRSDLDLPAVGLHNYAKGRNTDIMCACFAFDDEQVYLWLPGMPVPPRLIRHIELGGEVHAHNATFEQELCNNVGTRKHGWPHIYTDQLVCTMARAYAMGLPGSLAFASGALGVAEQKDMAGRRLMLQYSQPKHVDVTGKIVWWDDPDGLKRLWEYCRQDVIVEREIGRRMMKLSPYEQKVWQIDQVINARGIAVDTPAVLAAISIMESEKIRLIKEIQDVSGNRIASTNAVQQIKTYLSSRGVAVGDSLAKGDVVDLLAKPLPEDCRRVLEIRKEAGKSSTAKLDAMLAGASTQDNRLRGMFQYSGANTRRWAGRRVQLQNLPRPKINGTLIDGVINGLKDGLTASEVDALYGPPMDILSNCLRGFLVATSGHNLLCSDFASIEARVIAWLAGEEKALEIFKTHGKIYEFAAGRIFSKPFENVSDGERQVGKVAVLALGYGGGVGAFRTMAKGYGVDISRAFDSLCTLATPDQRAWVEEQFRANRKRYDDITREEYVASDLTKTFWRLANPNIVQFWKDLESTAINAVKEPGSRFVTESGNVRFKVSGSFLWCQLPSSGVLCYPYPEIKAVKTPWLETKPALTYMTEVEKKWVRTKTYGGSLAENVTQAVARDLLADALLRLESRGFPVVMHAHDEVVCELPHGQGSIEVMSQIMCEIPVWAKGLPIKASGWTGKRYRK